MKAWYAFCLGLALGPLVGSVTMGIISHYCPEGCEIVLWPAPDAQQRGE